MTLTFKEKELVNIGASIATGCKPCTDYHFKKIRDAGASDEEIEQVISDAMDVRDRAKAIMESHGLKYLGITRDADVDPPTEETSRTRALVRVASAFAVNCTTSVKKYIDRARAIGISDADIQAVLDSAQFIKGEAAHYVGQIAKLKEEKDRLQQLLEELERTQAQLVQSEKMAALGKLVAGVVHEMNSPVGAINSANDIINRSVAKFVDAMEADSSRDDRKISRRIDSSLKALRESRAISVAANDRIRKIIDSLKGFAHLDEAAYKKVDLHEGLDNTITLLEHRFHDRVQVVKDFGDVPEVTCNPGEVNQVFMNLLTNADEAIKTTGTITIRTFERNGNAHIQIIDTGVGITPGRLERLFDPGFVRKGARMKAGLGLFTSASIVQKHQGRIEVDSKVGQGSTFTVILPVEGGQPESDEQPSRCDRLD
ncbi:MAG: carboxymuconolactone decarboxylase family protein [Candidatus Latescibacterota bacterium]|nr:MAG: carboxymuconolactone decarboxylase family protein [Candidatus Latescibacterota bacterium]